jgi:2',3'-cyclic-nucleotide 2'-phosphodiesterase (5'-nucleotidase family)
MQNEVYSIFKENYMKITRKAGILLVSAFVFAALVFTGCPMDSDDEDDKDGKKKAWDSSGDFELGTATKDIDGTDGRYKETALGNLIADGIAWFARESSGETVDFALHNGQNLKVDKLAAGKITNTDVLGTIGTDTLYLVTYTGEDVTTLINTFVNSDSDGKWNANCIALVSKEVSYKVTPDTDQTKPPHATEIKVNGAAIGTSKTYRVAVGDFIGKAEKGSLPKGDGTDLGPTKLSEAVAQYIYAQGTIDPPALGRITGKVPEITPPSAP